MKPHDFWQDFHEPLTLDRPQDFLDCYPAELADGRRLPLPILGLTLAGAVARKLGHGRYVPLGTSRKFWYRDDLSVALSSITTPEQQKRLYVDPRMLPLLDRRRVAVIDDVISSGASMAAAIQLLAACAVEPVVLGAAMLQSDRWKDRLGPDWLARTVGVFETPMLEKTSDGRWRAAS